MPTLRSHSLGSTVFHPPASSQRFSCSSGGNNSFPFSLPAIVPESHPFSEVPATFASASHQTPTSAGVPAEAGFQQSSSAPTGTTTPTTTITTAIAQQINSTSQQTNDTATPGVQDILAQQATTNVATRMRAKNSRSGRSTVGGSSMLDKIKNRSLKPGVEVDTVHYPSHWTRLSPELQQKLIDEWKLNALDGPENYARTIPFKAMMNNFGRTGFDFYEYRFEAATCGENPVLDKFWVMWDYHNGLVRIHDMFACCKPGKTEPGKAVNLNIIGEDGKMGLPQIVQAVTGGNLEAQGYWIPFSAARALLARFCYPIREPLTIMFGPEFMDECLKPDDEEYGNYKIDDEVIKACQKLHEENRAFEFSRMSVPLAVKTNSAGGSSEVSSRPSKKPRRAVTNTLPSPPTSTSKSFSEPPEAVVRQVEASPIRPSWASGSGPKEDANKIFWDPIRDCADVRTPNVTIEALTTTPAKSLAISPPPTGNHNYNYPGSREETPLPYQTPPEEPMSGSFFNPALEYQLSPTTLAVAMTKVSSKRKRDNEPTPPTIRKKSKATPKIAPASKEPAKKGKAVTASKPSNTRKAPPRSKARPARKPAPAPPTFAEPVPESMEIDGHLSEQPNQASDDTAFISDGTISDVHSDEGGSDTKYPLDACECTCGKEHCAVGPSRRPSNLRFQDNTFNNWDVFGYYYDPTGPSREGVASRWSYIRTSAVATAARLRQFAAAVVDQEDDMSRQNTREEFPIVDDLHGARLLVDLSAGRGGRG